MFQFFFFLLAFEFAHLIHGTSEICSRQYSEKIKECHAQKFDTTKNCSVQSSRHQKFSCNCLIEDPSKFGKWELKIIFSNKLNNPVTEYFDIYNSTTVPTLPSGGFVFARVGKFVRIYMDQPSYDKKAECHAYYQGKWMYNLHKNISDEDVELYGICGIQMRVRDDREGEWSLHQVLNYEKKIANFTIVIKRENYSKQALPDLMIGEESEVVSERNGHVTVTIEKPPGEIRRCFVDRDPKNLIFPTNVTPKHCGFEIIISNDCDYGKWIVTTEYQHKKMAHPLQLINNVYIYKSIKEEIISPAELVYAHDNANFEISLQNCANDLVYRETCRLVQKNTGKQYDFILDKSPTGKIHLVDDSCCRVYFQGAVDKLYGEWYIEKLSKIQSKKAHFTITKPIK